MKTATLDAVWDPKEDFRLGAKDVDGELTYLGSQVWRNPLRMSRGGASRPYTWLPARTGTRKWQRF